MQDQEYPGIITILKLREGRPNNEDAVKSGEIQLVVNTPRGRSSEFDDSYIRKSAIRHQVPYITTTAAALAAARGIAARREARAGVRSLQSYHVEGRVATALSALSKAPPKYADECNPPEEDPCGCSSAKAVRDGIPVGVEHGRRPRTLIGGRIRQR